MTEEEHEIFWRKVQCTVDKDVVRTDRSHPYFAGESNPNVQIMRYDKPSVLIRKCECALYCKSQVKVIFKQTYLMY